MIDKIGKAYIDRYIKSDVMKHLEANKVVLIYGPRRAGKTTLVTEIGAELPEKSRWVSGEDLDVHPWLASQSLEKLKGFLGSDRLLIIDEAQKIPNIGMNLKILVDQIEGVKILATGSSAFELAGQVGEPLVGRKWQYFLYPISQLELSLKMSRFDLEKKLEQFLSFGSYPEVWLREGIIEKKAVLEDILDGSLYKDILMLDGIKKSAKVVDLLRLLAFQIGKEVSLTELASNLAINLATVERYLGILEKMFVIRKVGGFRRNLRSEVIKTHRYYFLDNGVRNVVVGNFNRIEDRDDVGMLWENFVFSERLKNREYKKIYANEYFWRTYEQKEIDLVEEREGKLFGYEFKWGVKPPKEPRLWRETYRNAQYKVINKENYLDFIV